MQPASTDATRKMCVSITWGGRVGERRMQKQRCDACFEAPPFRAAHLSMRSFGGWRAVIERSPADSCSGLPRQVSARPGARDFSPNSSHSLRRRPHPAAFADARRVGVRRACRPEFPLRGRAGGRLGGRAHDEIIRLLRRPSGRLVVRPLHVERRDLTDNDEKNYPDDHTHQRIENEIFQCISLADWRTSLDSGVNDISASLNDTSREGNRF